MISLTKEMILKLHKDAVRKYGGLDGIRDENLLLSAIMSPFQTFGGKELYPSIIEKAARMCYAIIKNHPFVDGNKRTAFFVLSVLLLLNNITFFSEKKEIIYIIESLASGYKSYDEFLVWLKNHTE